MAEERKCMKCEKPATHKITKIVKGQVFDFLFCDDHAESFSSFAKRPQANLVELLHQILKQQERMAVDEGPNCPNCGLTYDAYRKTLLLGCSECYQAFGDLIVNDLRKIHGAVSHYPEREAAALPETAHAQSPARPSSFQEDEFPSSQLDTDILPEELLTIERMKAQMSAAIEREDFEKAAQLRDAVKRLESVKPEEDVFCDGCGVAMVPVLVPSPKMGKPILYLGCPACKRVVKMRPAGEESPTTRED
ncbi:UvrB/UvrC motif-containing protein [bacterium]|nr:UvrB/UvrC motif-containing protein [bacterium]